MQPHTVGILKGLLGIPWIDVVFLINSGGQLLVSVGGSPAFSATGAFRGALPQLSAGQEPDSSLYMTALSPDVYLGLIFRGETPIEDVRAEVSRVEPQLSAALSV